IPGIYVLPRMNKSEDEIIGSLTEFMHKFAKFSKHDRIMNKMAAQRVAGTANWKKLITHYLDAYNLAVDKKWS
ncbi:hypothetical protein KA005_48260, partial [bacterium]|nr:hypothetical protein [bacterium]